MKNSINNGHEFCVTYICSKGSVRKDYITSLTVSAARKQFTGNTKNCKEILSIQVSLI